MEKYVYEVGKIWPRNWPKDQCCWTSTSVWVSLPLSVARASLALVEKDNLLHVRCAADGSSYLLYSVGKSIVETSHSFVITLQGHSPNYWGQSKCSKMSRSFVVSLCLSLHHPQEQQCNDNPKIWTMLEYNLSCSTKKGRPRLFQRKLPMVRMTCPSWDSGKSS